MTEIDEAARRERKQRIEDEDAFRERERVRELTGMARDAVLDRLRRGVLPHRPLLRWEPRDVKGAYAVEVDPVWLWELLQLLDAYQAGWAPTVEGLQDRLARATTALRETAGDLTAGEWQQVAELIGESEPEVMQAWWSAIAEPPPPPHRPLPGIVADLSHAQLREIVSRVYEYASTGLDREDPSPLGAFAVASPIVRCIERIIQGPREHDPVVSADVRVCPRCELDVGGLLHGTVCSECTEVLLAIEDGVRVRAGEALMPRRPR